MSTFSGTEQTRRRLTAKKADVAQALVDAAVAILRDVDYEALTIKAAAARAGVGRATAYTYFASKNHLVAEVYWHRVAGIEPPKTKSADPSTRAVTVLCELALLMASEPALARAVTIAMCSSDANAVLLRDKIGLRVHRLIAEALADTGDSVMIDLLEDVYFGVLIYSGNAGTYSEAELCRTIENAVLHLFGIPSAS
ncbi:TetR family transcriptional regulator [Nocardia macrotermitis]|uniref:TetR family transcriptional regulator n=1 Tax=Nocardia macrotermitis TaxID=2585198 RepID=UPI001885BD4C|nr:TetR family transcriptional regulator [Nocardia macrotermitis]